MTHFQKKVTGNSRIKNFYYCSGSIQGVAVIIQVKKKEAILQKFNHKSGTLSFKINEAEIEKLSYERYAYPHPMVRKRIFAVYLKMAFNYDNRAIGLIAGLHYNMVGFWINVFKEKGFDGLLTNNYGTNKSELENHVENIVDSFSQRPPINTAEAMERIRELTGINRSEQQVRAFMKRHGLKFIKRL